MVALVEENLPSEPPLYLPALANEPFDGMMGSTLELRIEQTPTSERSARADADLSWLGPREVSRALYPNSLGLSDDQVSRLASGLYRQVRPTSEGELAAMVKLARNEAQLVDLFVPIGESFARLYEEAMTPAGEALHAMLDGLGLLSDPEILQALRMWKENRHDPQFWTDDDGRRLKAVRLVGAFVMRKKGEPICALSAPLPGSSGHLERLHGLLSHARRLWLERQSLVRQHFPAQAAAFGASFVVQRGINARPGFFWLEPPEAR
jgi:hypothetical protein